MIDITQDDIKGTWQVLNDNEPLVSIHCMTYNHEPYIRQCLEGFVQQKTNFRFEVIVHDDASIDKTTEIVYDYAEKYPDIINPIFQTENQYSKHDGSIRRIMRVNTRGKYIAWCEGDDYWIDSLKLQKQVDFLEKNLEYGMCYTNFNIYSQERDKMQYDIYNSFPQQFNKEYISIEEFVYKKGFVCPPTWLYRKEISDNFEVGIKSLDTSFLLFAHFLYSTKVYYMPDVTTVYRMHMGSVSHSKSYKDVYKRNKSLLETQLYMVDKYALSASLRDKCIGFYYRTNLHHFIMHKQLADVEEAKRVLKHPSFYMKCCFILSGNGLGRLFIVSLYVVYKFGNWIQRHGNKLA